MTPQRQLAMVATEAAMQREKDPVRYARLERRNALAAGFRPPSSSAGLGAADALWLEQVDAGRWVPEADFSNCLGLAPLEHVVLIVGAAHGLTLMRFTLPNDGAFLMWTPDDIAVPIVMPRGGQLELCALGGPASLRLVVASDYPSDYARSDTIIHRPDRQGLVRKVPVGEWQTAGQWQEKFEVELGLDEAEIRLDDGVPVMHPVEGRIMRLQVMASGVPHPRPQPKDNSDCHADGAGGWNCCACGCNNHDLRSECRECGHLRCGAVAAERI